MHLGSSCLPLHVTVVEIGQMGYSRAGAVPVHLDRQIHVVRWIRVTRLTSGSEDLRLQGDQPQRGLRPAAAGGIQGISPKGTTISCS